jgi:hypothetical protein
MLKRGLPVEYFTEAITKAATDGDRHEATKARHGRIEGDVEGAAVIEAPTCSTRASCSVPSTGGQETLPKDFFGILLEFLEGRIVDAVGQNQPGQRVLYSGDPVIIRRTLFFDSFTKP